MLITLLITTLSACAQPFEYKTAKNGYTYVFHNHNESSFQKMYCKNVGGILEYELPDKTRADCLTNDYAIEFDFANKWAESIGQALHYGLVTGKKPKVVLILDNKYKKGQMIYFYRVKKIGDEYGIDVDYITEDILNLKNGKCQNLECKCYKVKSR